MWPACARVHGCEKTSRDVVMRARKSPSTAFSLGSAFAQKQPVVKINEQFQPEPSHPGVSARVSERFVSSVQTKPWSECARWLAVQTFAPADPRRPGSSRSTTLTRSTACLPTTPRILSVASFCNQKCVNLIKAQGGACFV